MWCVVRVVWCARGVLCVWCVWFCVVWCVVHVVCVVRVVYVVLCCVVCVCCLTPGELAVGCVREEVEEEEGV